MVDSPNGHFSSNYINWEKKTCCDFLQASRTLRIQDTWWQLITSLLGICPQTSWNTPKTLDFASHIRHLQLAHLPVPIKDLQDERRMNSYQNGVNKFKEIPYQSPFNQSTGFVWKTRHTKILQQVRIIRIFL